MNFDAHINRAAGYFQLELFDEAWNQLEEIEATQKHHPKVLSLRLGILKRLEKWEIGAVRAFPDSTMLYVIGACHIKKHESNEGALNSLQADKSF